MKYTQRICFFVGRVRVSPAAQIFDILSDAQIRALLFVLVWLVMNETKSRGNIISQNLNNNKDLETDAHPDQRENRTT